MIAEQHEENINPASFFSDEINQVDACIMHSFIQVTPKFLQHLKNGYKKLNLNEEELTQEFVALLRREINSLQYSFCVGQEYKDIFNNSTGRVDFYFYPLEEGKSTQSIYSCEAKRLPAPPPNARRKEYVIGENKNGAIERFKIEKHGKGLDKSAIIAFIETEDFKYWNLAVNDWIRETAQNNCDWNSSEFLSAKSAGTIYSIYYSKITTVSGSMFLNHFWINIQN